MTRPKFQTLLPWPACANAAREQDKARRTTTFTGALENMKILAEGGTLPPAPARGGRGGGAPPATGGQRQ